MQNSLNRYNKVNDHIMRNKLLKVEKMKIFIFLLYLSIHLQSVAQTKYFVLENNKDFELSSFKMNTQPLYKVNREVTLFNLMKKEDNLIGKDGKLNGQSDYNIILFSVLPDLSGKEDWEKIDLDTIHSSIITFDKLQQLHTKNTLSYFNNVIKETTKYFNTYKIIVKKGSDYYKPKFCLLQFYSVRNRPDVFTSVYGTINTEDSKYSIIEFEKIFKETYPRLDFPLNRMGEEPLSFIDWTRDRKEYLSKKISLGNNLIGYQFWTYIDWTKHHFQYDFERGIDRFIYFPGKGIIAGSFDFYFYFHRKELPIGYADFMQNIKEEKVMIADNYK